MDPDDTLLALKRIAEDAAEAEGPEEALWHITRALPAMLGDPAAALRPNAFREVPPPFVGTAAAFFMRMPDGAHHVITASVNFPRAQHHELVRITLGHPGEVARTRRPLLLRDTALHPNFVKILQSFRAGSSMFAPLLWRGAYLGVLICANSARGTFSERDLLALQAFAGLASALWVAQGGPAWLAALDTSSLPVRNEGT
ncbi:MAG TPA: GAF domain-containing protein [Acetobacteraceae bacterium]|nr:GAF domain-containing protein [Acetobacteraceae bacterium]